MKKKVFAMLMCFVMALALLPTTAFAADDPIKIGGVGLNETNCYYVNGTNGAVGTATDTAPATGWNAHYDGTKLTLNGLELDYTASITDTPYGILIHGDIALELHGASNISVRRDDGNTVSGMSVYGNLTVTGDEGSSLTATGENGTGIYVNNDLFVTSGSFTGNGIGGTCTGVWVGRDITVSGTGSLAGESSEARNYNDNHIQCCGVSAIGSITVSDNGRLEGHFKGTNEAFTGNFTCTGIGIQANLHSGGGTITVNGGTLLASALKNAKCTDDTQALDPALTLGAGITAEGSGNTNGTNLVSYAAADNGAYKYVIAESAPIPQRRSGGSGSGKTTAYSKDDNVKVIVESGDVAITALDKDSADYTLLLRGQSGEPVMAYEIDGERDGEAIVMFYVGRENAGKEYTVLHKLADGSIEEFHITCAVNGWITARVKEFSPFMVFAGNVGSGTVITSVYVENPDTGASDAVALAAALGALALLGCCITIDKQTRR